MELVLLGASNPETARVLSAVMAADPSIRVRCFIDNDPQKKGTTFVGYPVVGGFEMLGGLAGEDLLFVNLITRDTRTRYETSRELARRGCRFANLVHPSVDLAMTSLGVGNYIQQNVIIQAGARVGNNCSIHMASLVSHEVSLGDSVFVAHGVSISGCVSIGDGACIGTNATILPRLRVGKWAKVGAGAVVIKDVPDYATVFGNPGRVYEVAEPVYADGDIFEKGVV